MQKFSKKHQTKNLIFKIKKSKNLIFKIKKSSQQLPNNFPTTFQKIFGKTLSKNYHLFRGVLIKIFCLNISKVKCNV